MENICLLPPQPKNGVVRIYILYYNYIENSLIEDQILDLPPKWVSPAVDFTSKIPSSIVKIDTSNVPPPRSKMRTLRSPCA